MSSKLCTICSRETESGEKYCVYHETAYNNMAKSYEAWRRAYGEISWDEYLKRLASSPETGKWVKEVAELELKSKKAVPDYEEEGGLS